MLAALDAGLGETRAVRVLLPRALELGEAIVEGLRERANPSAIALAGSVRRQADSVKDLDVVAASERPEALVAALGELDVIESVNAAEPDEEADASATRQTAARARTHTGLSVDVRIVGPERYGNLLQHFTGSARHNTSLREAAVRRGLHVSEYGVLDDRTGESATCATEEEVYGLLGLAYIEPELREDRGELDGRRRRRRRPAGARSAWRTSAATCTATRSPPTGTTRSRRWRWPRATSDIEYLAITDHSASHGFGNDVSPDELRRQIERVRAVDARLEGIRVLAGSEVNILPDGSLDYDDDLLAELDWVVASVHTSFAAGEQAMTERIVRAVRHPLVDVIGHPTGRLIERREPYAVDLEAVFAAAAESGTMLEINANPARRDLNDSAARAAAAAGVRIVVDSDAHRTTTLANMRWGIATARRAWLGPEQIANTRTWAQLQALRKPGRARQLIARRRGTSSCATRASTAAGANGARSAAARSA